MKIGIQTTYRGDIVLTAKLSFPQFRTFFANEECYEWQIEEAKKKGRNYVKVEQYCGSQPESAGVVFAEFLAVGVVPKVRLPEFTPEFHEIKEVTQ